MSAQEWLVRLRDRLRRSRLERELAEELEFRRQQLEGAARAGGASPADAALLARELRVES